MKLYLTEPFRYKVRDIDLRPTYRCQLRCPTCGSWKRNTPDLSLDQTKQIIKYFRKFRKVICEGGEPLLWKHLIYFLQNIKADDLCVITNAYNIDKVKEICTALTPEQFRWVISLNGIRDTHDKSRGRKGAFDALVKSCDIMKSKGFDMRFQFVAVKENIHELDVVKAFIKEMYGREYINISYPSDAGIYGQNIKCTYLNNQEMRTVLLRDEFEFSRAGLLNKLIHDVFTDKVNQKELIPCLYGRSKIHINPEGRIYACQYNDISELQFGQVYEDRVEIDNKMRKYICKRLIPHHCQYYTGRLCSHESAEYSIRHNFFYLAREMWKRLI